MLVSSFFPLSQRSLELMGNIPTTSQINRYVCYKSNSVNIYRYTLVFVLPSFRISGYFVTRSSSDESIESACDSLSLSLSLSFHPSVVISSRSVFPFPLIVIFSPSSKVSFLPNEGCVWCLSMGCLPGTMSNGYSATLLD